MLVFGFDRRSVAKINLYSLAHDSLAIENLSDSDCGVFIVEGDYNAAEGLQRGPGMDGRGGVDEVFDDLEVVWAEDFGILEVGDEESV